MPEILLIVLGDEGIEKTWGLSTTQSNEAANRALSSRCPQNVKFSKSITARLGSAILTWNNGPGDAQRKISHRLGLPMSRGRRDIMQLNRRETHTVRGTGGAPQHKPADCSRMLRRAGI
ncbi:hypothetical protein, partial [Thiolapillus sp.]|uniref:hypothetical protein n=1 Tax=Thiolapillus sp. TaxID=2017437 RepID=UPI003AF87955